MMPSTEEFSTDSLNINSAHRACVEVASLLHNTTLSLLLAPMNRARHALRDAHAHKLGELARDSEWYSNQASGRRAVPTSVCVRNQAWRGCLLATSGRRADKTILWSSSSAALTHCRPPGAQVSTERT